MADNNETSSSNNSSESETMDEFIPSRFIQFWTILAFQIPSLACTLFLLSHLLINRHLRRAMHNHVIIILLVIVLVIEIIDNPLYLDGFLHNGSNSFPPSSAVCLIWWFVDYGFYGALTVFLAWASFERHILIFYHRQLLSTFRKIILVHYMPLVVLSLYLIGFYVGVIFFPPCQNVFDFQYSVCGQNPCYENVPWLSLWDNIFNGLFCTLLEAVFSISLLLRVIWQRHQAHQPIHWRKHRKMTIQLLSISCLSLSIVFPISLIQGVQQIGVPSTDNFGSQLEPYFYYLYTFVVLLFPFVVFGCLPELWPKLFFCKKQRTIGPVTIILSHRRGTRPTKHF